MINKRQLSKHYYQHSKPQIFSSLIFIKREWIDKLINDLGEDAGCCHSRYRANVGYKMHVMTSFTIMKLK